MVNMGELFAHRRIGDIEMERVPLHERHPERDLLEPLDLLFARQSIVAEGAGKASIFLGAPEPVTFESHLIRARIDQTKADPTWLFYFFESPTGRARIRSIVTQVTAAGIRGSDLGLLPVPCPDVERQHEAAAVLRSLDDKIDSNRRLAGICEEVARAEFVARFVTFTGRGDLVNTELGWMPNGWTVAPIGDVLKVVGGSTPSTKEPRYWDGGTNSWATPKDLAGLSSPVLLDTARHITDEGVNRISSGLLPERTVLMSSRAPVGYTAMSMVEVAVNQGFIAIPPSGAMPSEFVLFWLRENMDRIHAHAGGTTFAEISKRAFRPLLIQVPPPDALSEFEAAARPLLDLVAGLEREIRILAVIRKTLLPKLISGEVRVSQRINGRS